MSVTLLMYLTGRPGRLFHLNLNTHVLADALTASTTGGRSDGTLSPDSALPHVVNDVNSVGFATRGSCTGLAETVFGGKGELATDPESTL